MLRYSKRFPGLLKTSQDTHNLNYLSLDTLWNLEFPLTSHQDVFKKLKVSLQLTNFVEDTILTLRDVKDKESSYTETEDHWGDFRRSSYLLEEENEVVLFQFKIKGEVSGEWWTFVTLRPTQ